MSRHTTRPDSGVLWLRDGVLRYRSPEHGSWNLRLHDIAVIGEYKTDAGPYIDDWFMVFVHPVGHRWHESSVYAEGTDAALAELGRAVGADLKPGLDQATGFTSRVLWPVSLREAGLFKFSKQGGLYLLQMLRQWFTPRVERRLGAKVREYLHRRR